MRQHDEQEDDITQQYTRDEIARPPYVLQLIVETSTNGLTETFQPTHTSRPFDDIVERCDRLSQVYLAEVADRLTRHGAKGYKSEIKAIFEESPFTKKSKRKSRTRLAKKSPAKRLAELERKMGAMDEGEEKVEAPPAGPADDGAGATV